VMVSSNYLPPCWEKKKRSDAGCWNELSHAPHHALTVN
jgi:hypothetical protein